MNLQSKVISRAGIVTLLAGALLVSTACGIRKYPGQPGVVTHEFSKLNMEYLDSEGLFTYQVSYDNRAGKGGVTSVVTKLNPGARTYTSNVRTNSEGSKYITKEEYAGTVVQLIYLPPTNELIVPEGSKVVLIVDYDLSMDEIDHKNMVELNMFKGTSRTQTAFGDAPSARTLRNLRTRLNLMKAGKLDVNGTLSYTVLKARFGQQEFVPARPVQVQTNLVQSGARSTMTFEMQKQLAAFIEAKFPQGFEGAVQFFVSGSSEPLEFELGLHTAKTIQTTGVRVHRVTQAEALRVISRTSTLTGVRK